MIRIQYRINGQVQGVGFRPFVYKCAQQNALVGFVKNDSSGVEVEVEGDAKNIAFFEEQLRTQLPPLARIDSIEKTSIKLLHDKSFVIVQSSQNQTNSKTALISPDIAACQECLNDIQNSGKYHNYFATNCTNCGPRYSIVKTVPYDRKNTSMKAFVMCASCQEEYTNPNKRRYHAQPISCHECGPKLSGTILETAQHILEGKIVAIKGIGGFHIICDASNDEAVLRLRKHKNRPTKPLAIMCKNIRQIESLACVNEKEEELLTSKEAPIVILNKLTNKEPMPWLRMTTATQLPYQAKASHRFLEQEPLRLSNLLAPNIDRIGCFLPYTPLHHLLFEHLQMPLVATSANLANEPIITNKEDILKKLPFVEFILDYDREIINGVDDSLLQVVNGKMQTLRLARGYAPKVIKLPFKSEKKILAVGANAKNAIAFVIEDNIILSPHIGDLDSLEAFDFFTRTIETFQRFYDFEPDIIVCDKHPSYMSTSWAKKQNVPLQEVGHHLAHIYACKAEFGLQGDYLGFSFDGTGYGEGNSLWGGEVFVGDTRKYTFKPIKLLGGEKAIKEPRRVALSMLFDTYTLEEVLALDLACVKEFTDAQIKILHQSYTKNLNAPLSSSVGRMFDAVASFASLLQTQSYEGEAGLICEQNYNPQICEPFLYTIENGVISIAFDFFDKDIVSRFMNTLVKIVLDIAKKEKREVILSGGVFQNKTLLELLACKLEKEKITYFHQQTTPINDGGIALGQAYYFCLKNRYSV